MEKIFYHAYVDGFMKQASTVAEIQNWLDGIRSNVVGCELKVTRVVDCLMDKEPCIKGIVTA